MKTEKQVRTWEIINKGGFLERDEQKVFGPNTDKVKVIAHKDHLAIVAELEKEIRYLRHYGNKDCTYMAEEAMEKNELDEK